MVSMRLTSSLEHGSLPPMKLMVTFEAKDSEMMVEAARSFLDELQIGFSMREPHIMASDRFSLGTSGWSYECRRTEGP